jgi:hypothetical protein
VTADDERIAKLEAWIRELESRQRDLARTQGKWLRGFTGLAVGSLGGFVFGPWVGGACAFTGGMMAVFGFYTVLGRAKDYERDLENARRDVARLRAMRRA